MSIQILVQGRIAGARQFFLAGSGVEDDLTGRVQWIGLLSEVLPRALIAELGLSKMLLGSAGGDQFLLVLPEEAREAAVQFLSGARDDMRRLSGGQLEFYWAITENLGDWSDVRKRLTAEMQRKQGTPLAFSAPGEIAAAEAEPEYFAAFGRALYSTQEIGWSPESPARVRTEGGKHTWPLGGGQEAIPLARHAALNDSDTNVASAAELARRAEGRPLWGVLRGDVDNFVIRMRRLNTIEEHVQISVMFRQFFAGEIEVLCSMPEFWRKVSVLYAGGDDFAVYGAWDALIGFARELRRLFGRFAEEKLNELPGPEGKTLSMAVALAPGTGARLDDLFDAAGERLEIAKSAGKDVFDVFGRILEWKQVTDAAELKDDLMRMLSDFGARPDYIRELCGIYRETRRDGAGRRKEPSWRFHRRLTRILAGPRTREFQKARAALAVELAGKNPANVKMRPSGRVALEWARLSVPGPV